MGVSQDKMEKREAWSAAKLAVRSYSRNPSEANERKVREAWIRVRRNSTAPRQSGRLAKVVGPASEA